MKARLKSVGRFSTRRTSAGIETSSVARAEEERGRGVAFHWSPALHSSGCAHAGHPEVNQPT